MCNVVTCHCGTRLRFGATAEHVCDCNGGAITDAISEGLLTPGMKSRSDTEVFEDRRGGPSILTVCEEGLPFPDLQEMRCWEDIVDSDPETRGLRDVRL
jgi:hypothetical protein